MSRRTAFDAYVVVDWSANNQPKTGDDSIWYCVLERTATGVFQVETRNPATRLLAYRGLRESLTTLARRGCATLIGFDFAFGYPGGFADALGIQSDQPWLAIWRRISKLVIDSEQNRSNRFLIAAELNAVVSGTSFPFWGCPASQQRNNLKPNREGRYGPTSLEEFRVTDKRNRGPQPVWKLCYPGAVGSQTLLGIPYVEKLRFDPELQGVSCVWPFETGFRLVCREERPWKLLFAEVYPSLRRWPQQPYECKDLAQVRGLAEYWTHEDEGGRMAEWFAPPHGLRSAELERLRAEEGWILGVR